MSNQGLRQASVRDVTGTALTYEGDFHALWNAKGIGGVTFNERMLLWINDRLGASYVNVQDAMNAFAVDQGFANWSSMGTFDAGGAPPIPPPLDGWSDVAGAWSFSRVMVPGYAGSFYTDAGAGAISALFDQSGNARNLTQGTGSARPALSTGGANSRACGNFDGSNDNLAGAVISNFLSASVGYMVAAFIADRVNSASADFTGLDGILGDGSGGYLSLCVGNPAAAGNSVAAGNWDGTGDQAIVAASIATLYVAEWRHTGGNVFVRVNGGTEQSVASGNTEDVTNAFRMGRAFGRFFDGKIFEAVVASSMPSVEQRDALVANMLAHIGA